MFELGTYVYSQGCFDNGQTYTTKARIASVFLVKNEDGRVIDCVTLRNDQTGDTINGEIKSNKIKCDNGEFYHDSIYSAQISYCYKVINNQYSIRKECERVIEDSYKRIVEIAKSETRAKMLNGDGCGRKEYIEVNDE